MGEQVVTGIDLFAGAGGFSLGMEMAGVKVVAAVENDHAACETLRINQPKYHKDTLIVESDIQSVPGLWLLGQVGLKVGELGILFGGPPCQGFSLANTKTRGLDDPRSKLMWEFIRLTREMKPKMIYVENVPGCFAFKDFFALLMQNYEEAGYVTRCLMMDACSYGVPQTRKRIFIQGARDDLGCLPEYPVPQNFDKKALKKKKNQLFTPADVAIEAFAKNGFPKEVIKDLWWNETLWIQMNRKTAAADIDAAIDRLVIQGITNSIQSSIVG